MTHPDPAGADERPERIARMVAEMQALCDREHPLILAVHPLVALQLAGLIQLATRHPQLAPNQHHCARIVLDQLRTYFAESPTVLEVMTEGDDPARDVPWGL